MGSTVFLHITIHYITLSGQSASCEPFAAEELLVVQQWQTSKETDQNIKPTLVKTARNLPGKCIWSGC